jgi:hypothetical protein
MHIKMTCSFSNEEDKTPIADAIKNVLDSHSDDK